ncbi:MAG TPA: hypothetical protein VMT38_01795 [Terracidiphilus sp.]|nr:hypothetical protein [Terracidiphilus sp.]
MSDGFSIGAAMAEPTIFECPNCRETIDAAADACRFCGARIDKEAARAAAELMARINKACSDASYMKSTTFTLPVFFGLRFVPFISLLGTIGFIGLLIGIPIWVLVWRHKYNRIVTSDRDFLKAKRTVFLIGVFVPMILALFVIVPFLVGILIAMNR